MKSFLADSTSSWLDLRLLRRCPTFKFLVATGGPWLTVLGFISINKVICQPLTYSIDRFRAIVLFYTLWEGVLIMLFPFLGVRGVSPPLVKKFAYPVQILHFRFPLGHNRIFVKISNRKVGETDVIVNEYFFD